MQIILVASAHKNEGLGHVLRGLEIKNSLEQFLPKDCKIDIILYSNNYKRNDYEKFFDIKNVTLVSSIDKLNFEIDKIIGIYKIYDYKKNTFLLVDSISIRDEDILLNFDHKISLSPIGKFNSNSDVVIARKIIDKSEYGSNFEGFKYAVFNSKYIDNNKYVFQNFQKKKEIVLSLSFGGNDVNNFGLNLAKNLLELDGFNNVKIKINHYVGLTSRINFTNESELLGKSNYKIYKSNNNFWKEYINGDLAILANGLTQLEAMYANMPHVCILNSQRNLNLAPVNLISSEFIIYDNHTDKIKDLLMKVMLNPEILNDFTRKLKENQIDNGSINVAKKILENFY